jgi:hypothetical protein
MFLLSTTIMIVALQVALVEDAQEGYSVETVTPCLDGRKIILISSLQELNIWLPLEGVTTIPWLLNEDGALKLKLQGIRVTDANATTGRTVPVRFRLPETEVADLSFPIIVIQHDDIAYAPERQHDGYGKLPYAPEGYGAWWDTTVPGPEQTFDPHDSPYYSWFPTAYNLDYTVTVYTRIMHEHMIPIVSTLATYPYLHPRFGFLDIPQDGTKRTLQVLGGGVPQYGKDNNGKRIFMTAYKVRVFSELVPAIVQTTLANTINLDLSVYTSDIDISPLEVSESKALMSVGTSTAWNVQQPLPE